MRTPKTATVIGGGIIGLSTALALQSRGLQVQLYDAQGDRPPASWGNAGHIAIEQHEPLASWSTIRSIPRRLMIAGGPASFPPSAIAHWLPFGLRLLNAARLKIFQHGQHALQALLSQALPAWRRLMVQVNASELLKEHGHIIAWSNVQSAQAGRSAWSMHDNPLVRWRDLTTEEARLLNAQLSQPVADAIRLEGTASVADPGAVLTALHNAVLRNGGNVENKLISVSMARSNSDITVIAAGVHSSSLMHTLKQSVPMIAERGYHIQSAQSSWPDALPPVVFEDRAMVVTRFTSGLRATSYTEFTHPGASADARKWERLKLHAKELGLSFDGEITTWLGSRPTLPDYLPAIGRCTRAPDVLYAFGHQHLGLTLGPVTGEIIAALAIEEKPPLDIAAFAIDRFD